MQVTDRALQALVLAAEAAHTLGEKPVTSYHLLLGLADAEGGARHVLGLRPERLRDAAAALSAESPADARPSFPTAKEVVEDAVGHANASGHDRATTADILLAALGPREGAVALLLRAAGVEPAAMRAALAGGDHDACCGETGISALRPFLAELGSHADRLPGRLWTVARLGGALIPYLLLYCAVLAVTWDTSGPELILAMGGGTLLLLSLLRPVLVGRRVRRAVARVPVRLVVPENIRPLLERLGLDRLEVRVQPGDTPDRCYRRGRRAWIVIAGHTENHPEWSRFVLWHEVAHLARRDITAWHLGAGMSGSLVVAALAGFDPRALAIAVVGTAVVAVAGRWWSEAACDRFAVRRAGPDALHAWAADRRDTTARLRRRNALSRRARAKGLLTHPPLTLRTALHPGGSPDQAWPPGVTRPVS
jgi:Zn-dependent protease with chaperone function